MKKCDFFEKRWEGMEIMGVMGADGSYADGWTRLPAGAIDKRNKEKPSEKKNIRKEKHQKKKKKKAVG